MKESIISKDMRSIRPEYTTREQADDYKVRVFMPGVPKDGVSISLENEELTVEGVKRADVPSSCRCVARESADAAYRLRLALNVQIDGGGISASMEDGVLTLVLPKSEAVKPKRIAVM
jgi:HSP20 family protein